MVLFTCVAENQRDSRQGFRVKSIPFHVRKPMHKCLERSAYYFAPKTKISAISRVQIDRFVDEHRFRRTMIIRAAVVNRFPRRDSSIRRVWLNIFRLRSSAVVSARLGESYVLELSVLTELRSVVDREKKPLDFFIR
jgi:hypothetical protein